VRRGGILQQYTRIVRRGGILQQYTRIVRRGGILQPVATYYLTTCRYILSYNLSLHTILQPLATYNLSLHTTSRYIQPASCHIVSYSRSRHSMSRVLFPIHSCLSRHSMSRVSTHTVCRVKTGVSYTLLPHTILQFFATFTRAFLWDNFRLFLDNFYGLSQFFSTVSNFYVQFFHTFQNFSPNF